MDGRTGKIARLPHEVRLELNQRLHDGLQAADILPWLIVQYAADAAELASIEDPRERWTRLRQLSADLARLRNADLSAEAIRIENDRLALAQSRAADMEKRRRFSPLARRDRTALSE